MIRGLVASILGFWPGAPEAPRFFEIEVGADAWLGLLHTRYLIWSVCNMCIGSKNTVSDVWLSWGGEGCWYRRKVEDHAESGGGQWKLETWNREIGKSCDFFVCKSISEERTWQIAHTLWKYNLFVGGGIEMQCTFFPRNAIQEYQLQNLNLSQWSLYGSHSHRWKLAIR